MKRIWIVLVTSLVLGLAGGVESAFANLLPPPKDAVAGTVQSATQSNDATNTANQTATSAPVVENASPNTAIANGSKGDPCNPCAPSGGNVTQNSGSTVNAPVTNNATQTNGQSNAAGQSQTAGQTGTTSDHCCSKP